MIQNQTTSRRSKFVNTTQSSLVYMVHNNWKCYPRSSNMPAPYKFRLGSGSSQHLFHRLYKLLVSSQLQVALLAVKTSRRISSRLLRRGLAFVHERHPAATSVLVLCNAVIFPIALIAVSPLIADWVTIVQSQEDSWKQCSTVEEVYIAQWIKCEVGTST